MDRVYPPHGDKLHLNTKNAWKGLVTYICGCQGEAGEVKGVGMTGLVEAVRYKCDT